MVFGFEVVELSTASHESSSNIIHVTEMYCAYLLGEANRFFFKVSRSSDISFESISRD